MVFGFQDSQNEGNRSKVWRRDRCLWKRAASSKQTLSTSALPRGPSKCPPLRKSPTNLMDYTGCKERTSGSGQWWEVVFSPAGPWDPASRALGGPGMLMSVS